MPGEEEVRVAGPPRRGGPERGELDVLPRSGGGDGWPPTRRKSGPACPSRRCTLLTEDGGGAAIEAKQDVQPRAAAASYLDGVALISPWSGAGRNTDRDPSPGPPGLGAGNVTNKGSKAQQQRNVDGCDFLIVYDTAAKVGRCVWFTSASTRVTCDETDLVEGGRRRPWTGSCHSWRTGGGGRLVSKTFPYLRASLQDERFKRAHCLPSLIA